MHHALKLTVFTVAGLLASLLRPNLKSRLFKSAFFLRGLDLAARRVALAWFVTVVMLGTAAHAANLVSNSSFEDDGLLSTNVICPMTAWTGCAGNGGETSFYDAALNGHSEYLIINSNGNLGFVTQTIPTVVGQNYEFNFTYTPDGNGPTEFQALWNGNVLMDVSSSAYNPGWNNYTNGLNSGPAAYSFMETATSTSTTIGFGGMGNGFDAVGIDDVVVTPTTASVLIGLPGGTVSNPVGLPSNVSVGQISGSIGGFGATDFYQFLWSGGPFSATAQLSGANANSQYDYQLFDPNSILIQNLLLAIGNDWTATISDVLPPGYYTIGLLASDPNDPGFTLNFLTPVGGSAVPEPLTLPLLATGLGLMGLLGWKRRAVAAS